MQTKIITLILFLSLTAMCPPGQHKVLRVPDADTIYVSGYEKPIRILGIDAPENKHNYKIPKQAKRYGVAESEVIKLGKEAQEVASRMLLGKCVALESDYRDKGKYGRPLRYVQVGNIDYGEYMLSYGLVFSYCGDKKSSRYRRYNELSKFKCE